MVRFLKNKGYTLHMIDQSDWYTEVSLFSEFVRSDKFPKKYIFWRSFLYFLIHCSFATKKISVESNHTKRQQMIQNRFKQERFQKKMKVIDNTLCNSFSILFFLVLNASFKFFQNNTPFSRTLFRQSQLNFSVFIFLSSKDFPLHPIIWGKKTHISQL